MAKQWSCWTNWNSSVKQALIDAQTEAVGDDTILETRERAGAKGTCSILDVYSLGKREAGVTWVLSPSELQRYFGSKTPTKKAIAAGIDSFLAALGSGESCAVTAPDLLLAWPRHQ